ncbi:DUF4259 domain-containing protein [Corynebacterium mayonis]|uniref:DUF4259 domain-containing protein n=1 Tax=Corynebacterium mayonis TaxID=3062461 RepID=UPI0031406195
MGTWNCGPFDNDSALDTVSDLVEGTFNMDQFRFDCGAGHLDSDNGAAVVALNAVINGHVPSPKDAAALKYRFTFQERHWLKQKLREVLDPNNSELYQMWNDSGDLNKWLEETDRATR